MQMKDNETTGAGVQHKATNKIYTKLKFIRSEISGAPISFVSTNPISGQACGVRRDADVPKRICVCSSSIAETLVPNALYKCTLVPMLSGRGYVVIEAELMQFRATVLSSYIKNVAYRVEAKFGNKTVVFDPFEGGKESVRNLGVCLDVLKKRIDVQNLEQVVRDFEHAGRVILKLLDRDRYHFHK